MIPTLDPDEGDVTTVGRVLAYMATDITDADDVDVRSLVQAVHDGNALVLAELDRPTIHKMVPHARDAIVAVATRVAARIWRNPREHNSLTFGDTTLQYPSDGRILTGDERAALRPWKDTLRGPIHTGMTTAPAPALLVVDIP